MNKSSMFLALGVLAGLAGTARSQDWGLEHFDKTFRAPRGEAMEVVLDVDAGEVRVERGDSQDEVRVSMRYTRDEFREKVNYNESNGRLKVQLDSKRWKKWRGYSSDDRDSHAEVTVTLPHGVDLYLSTDISAGDIHMDLGGLRLKEFSFTNFAGEVELCFDEPNQVVMSQLNINAKIGEGSYLGLGNARFQRADINAGIGEIEVDFSGRLEPGARAKVDLDIGEATVIVPENHPVRMRIGGGWSFLSDKDIDQGLRRRGGDYINDRYEEDDEKAFLVRVSPGLGELRVNLE